MIRHAEPDYEKDSLTEKGFREAELLSKRTEKWGVTDFYRSPMGRARDTSLPTLKALHREAFVEPWLREFEVFIPDPATKKRRIPWDMMPGYLDRHRELFDVNRWPENPSMAAGKIKAHFDDVGEGMDSLLKRYGYRREGWRYRAAEDARRDAVVVCFCHLGVTCVVLSHLLNFAPHQLWQGFFIAPASVTVLGTEERETGEAFFRVQMMGDTSHLRAAGEEVSHYGYFTEPFQG